VACRELGFSPVGAEVVAALDSATANATGLPVVLDEVQCNVSRTFVRHGHARNPHTRSCGSDRTVTLGKRVVMNGVWRGHEWWPWKAAMNVN
jgi:hypothetical protein